MVFVTLREELGKLLSLLSVKHVANVRKCIDHFGGRVVCEFQRALAQLFQCRTVDTFAVNIMIGTFDCARSSRQ